MTRPSRVLRIPTERSWSWAPFKKQREVASFPPLRVLFCGSDAFSAPSFNMLRELHLRRADVVSALGVMIPAPKPSGRSLKVLKPTPMALLAQQMDYKPWPVHNFTLKPEELPPGGWDLTIAVSFGHKIPASVLQLCKAGGLNVHPSLLPRHRGPAPLHHTLLKRDSETGVSIQTIHPTEFDKGDVLVRSKIAVGDTTLPALSSNLARMGADLLRFLLLKGYPDNAPVALPAEEAESYAPKITKDETQISWVSWQSKDIALWSAVMGTLWTKLDGNVVKLYSLQCLSSSVISEADSAPGTIRFQSSDGASEAQLSVKCADGWISIGSLTIAGKKEKLGADAAYLDGKTFESP